MSPAWASPERDEMFRLPADAPRVKVCCIASLDEAKLAADRGATALGLVSEMPSGPGVIDEDTIAKVARWAPDEVATFLLTSRTDAETIADQWRRTRVDTLQLVDRLGPDGLARLRELVPETSLVQVIHVAGDASIDEAVRVAPLVDAILLDSGDPNLAVKQLGGTGRTHDWRVSRAIVESVDRPVYLAGGLTPENVGHALATVRPYGVDVCSGLRTHDRLDERLLEPFMDVIASFGDLT